MKNTLGIYIAISVGTYMYILQHPTPHHLHLHHTFWKNDIILKLKYAYSLKKFWTKYSLTTFLKTTTFFILHIHICSQKNGTNFLQHFLGNVNPHPLPNISPNSFFFKIYATSLVWNKKGHSRQIYHGSVDNGIL